MSENHVVKIYICPKTGKKLLQNNQENVLFAKQASNALG